MELDTHGGDERTQHQDHHSIQPCKNKNINSGTSYQQQCGYFITRKKELTCLLVLFRRDLIKQLKEWQTAGDKIILFMDHNKHMTEGVLGKALGGGQRRIGLA